MNIQHIRCIYLFCVNLKFIINLINQKIYLICNKCVKCIIFSFNYNIKYIQVQQVSYFIQHYNN